MDSVRRPPSSHGPGVDDRLDSAVRVVVRVRPQNAKEIANGGTQCVNFPSKETIELHEQTKTYDRVFDPDATQREVFDYVAKPMVSEVFNGYNGTIFAYGQTSSGKTHTMEGPSIHDEELAGVIPRTVREIFLCVGEAPDSFEFVIKVSYIEIYMEKIRDLLDPYHTKDNLPVREDKQRGVYVAGATEEYVTSADELMAVMAAGAKNRVVAATGMNQGSSRSHSVFIISLQQRNLNDSSTKTGSLFLVDLAGSEMVKKTHATGQVLEEAKTINKSLSALGQVINALTDDKKPHVPYRDSKLTRVLQNSLGGNSKTCLIVNCSPSSFNEAETQSTLRFGSRAKRITNKAVVNETRSVEELSALLSKANSTIDMQQTYIAALEKERRAIKASSMDLNQRLSRTSMEDKDDDTETQGAGENASAQEEETANAIRSLTEHNRGLVADLEEEKAEVKRSHLETNEYRQVLQEKERHIREMVSLLGDTERELARVNADVKEQREQYLQETEELTNQIATLAEKVEELQEERDHRPSSSTSPSTNGESKPIDVGPEATIGKDEKAAEKTDKELSTLAKKDDDALKDLLSGLDEWDAAALESDGLSDVALESVRSRESLWRDWQAAVTREIRKMEDRAKERSEHYEAVQQDLRDKLERSEKNRDRLEQDLKTKLEEEQVANGDRADDDPEVRVSLKDLTGAHRALLYKYRQLEVECKRKDDLIIVHRAALHKHTKLEGQLREKEAELAFQRDAKSQMERQVETLSKQIQERNERHEGEVSRYIRLVDTLQQEKEMRYPHQHLEKRSLRGGGADHQPLEVKTVRGGGGRYSHDDARPWGGRGGKVDALHFDSSPGAMSSPTWGRDKAQGDGGTSPGIERPRRPSILGRIKEGWGNRSESTPPTKRGTLKETSKDTDTPQLAEMSDTDVEEEK